MRPPSTAAIAALRAVGIAVRSRQVFAGGGYSMVSAESAPEASAPPITYKRPGAAAAIQWLTPRGPGKGRGGKADSPPQAAGAIANRKKMRRHIHSLRSESLNIVCASKTA